MIVLINARSGILENKSDSIGCFSHTKQDILAVRVFGRVIENLSQTTHQIEATGKNAERVGNRSLETNLQITILMVLIIKHLKQEIQIMKII